jgi:two-component system nitrate/nitrite response regulator NarL
VRPGQADQALPDLEESQLTSREHQVLKLLNEGSGTRAIAGQLGVSPATVKNHIHNILGKLGVHSRLEAVTLAGRWRLLR